MPENKHGSFKKPPFRITDTLMGFFEARLFRSRASSVSTYHFLTLCCGIVILIAALRLFLLLLLLLQQQQQQQQQQRPVLVLVCNLAVRSSLKGVSFDSRGLKDLFFGRYDPWKHCLATGIQAYIHLAGNKNCHFDSSPLWHFEEAFH